MHVKGDLNKRDHVNSAKKRREYVNQRCYGGGGGAEVGNTFNQVRGYYQRVIGETAKSTIKVWFL